MGETLQPGIDEVKAGDQDSSGNNNNKKRRPKNKKKKSKMMKMKGGDQGQGGNNHNGLLDYCELPEYMKENEYILRYYRSDWPLTRAFFSLFTFHNETINIWTHLLGFLLFVGLTIVHLDGVPQLAEIISHLPWSISSSATGNVSSNQGSLLMKMDTTLPSELLGQGQSSPSAARWPFFVFLSGAMFCLLTSTLCHLLCCHSHRLNLFLARLDYVGIAVMIVASFFPPIYYIFQCDPRWQFTYLTAITALGVFTVLNLLAPQAATGACRSYRALLFVAMGLSGFVPAVHGTIVNWSEPRRPVTLGYEMAMAASYLTGTLFYVSRIPERWKPGWFDLTGHSHQIFHVFVIGGALAHYGAALMFLEWRDRIGC